MRETFQQQTFWGVLEPDGTRLRWTVMRVPFDPAKVWPGSKGLRVRGTIRGLQPAASKAGARSREGRSESKKGSSFAFRTSLFKGRDGRCILLVNRQMQKGAGVRLGGAAEVVLEPDTEVRVVAMPPELEKVLRQNRMLRKWYDALSNSYRKAIADAVAQPKSAEARAGRAELWAERMLLAMEGERVMPPILELAFQRQPKARAGWEAMTPVQRRGHLMGIFSYQSPESREKRAQKAVEEALRMAGKVGGKQNGGGVREVDGS